jgi:uncharacterized damage-inducible protein DinB
MENQINNTELFVKMAVDAWDTQNSRLSKMLDTLTDEQLATETAPGRNSGTYLLGHSIAVNDALLPLLGFGARLYPQLEEPFLKKPENSGLEKPSLAELKNYWNKVNSELAQHIAKMKPEDWFQKHSSVSEEDFEKEPHRNKLNILINRANHQSYHLGQVAYLKSR